MRRIPHRADNAFEKILYEWLKQSDIWLSPLDRGHILALIDEACQRLRGLGYVGVGRWGPVYEVDDDRSNDRRLYYTADKRRVVEEDSPKAAFLMAPKGGRIPIEDAKRFGLVEETPQEKGTTIVIELVDKLWPLYWDHAEGDKLRGVPRILRQHFRYRPLDEFSDEAYERIKKHEPRAFEHREQPSTTDSTQDHSRPGPRPKTEDHGKLAMIVKPYGVAWKDDQNLSKICRLADGAKVFVPKEWSPITTWRGGYKKHKDKLIKVIASRLKKMALLGF